MLATQLAFGAMLRPKYVGNATPTLELAENILYYNAGRGIAPLLPLGLILSSRIESRLLEAARILGYAQIELPHIVSTEILKNGAPMASGFRDVLVPLSGRMHMQHLMCTPEMQIAQMLRASQASHRALPLRCCYIATFFRQLRQPRPLLKGREFRIFGAMTFGRANEELAGTVVELKALTVRLLEDLGIPYEEVSRGPTHFELFYPMVNGIDHYIIGKVRRRGLSLAMS
ncbi:MAG TPA: aminoacyl--tRNA ligase-related protein, partial [Candidatus Baltobacteraceae bacterium]|nr:aminoacyl--tRNA ligase-related protein [Candidatus Baltobacteraceae bacterium]